MREMHARPEPAPADQQSLVAATGLPVVETHISYVLLGGEIAYKIKKAVKLDFLDFTTLSSRRHFCNEELRLNKILAPSLYLDVVAITGTHEAPVIGGDGTPIEYAVRMRQFDQEGLLSRLVEKRQLTPALIDEIAATVAAFHDRAPRAGPDVPFGRAGSLLRPVRENFAEMTEDGVATTTADRDCLEQLRQWTEASAQRLTPAFQDRNRAGFVRECHGDLHLGNIARIDGKVTLFDRIEFNPSMRWIDVMSDVGFLVMDLRDRGQHALAARLLSAYLEITGDYAGLRVLRFYIVYRALVRAKIARLRLAQAGADDERERLAADYRTYLALATAETRGEHRGIVITHGFSGSGKTTRAREIVESTFAISVRSDVERKRLAASNRSVQGTRGIDAGLYAAEVTKQTYERLAALAREIVSAGYPVVIDATFLQRWQRDLVRSVAADLQVPFAIADCTATAEVLRSRIRERLAARHDASDATAEVLAHQQATAEPLSADEL
jgi:aminoglycoside phosphotransferase family enzyme/predicted kinase